MSSMIKLSIDLSVLKDNIANILFYFTSKIDKYKNQISIASIKKQRILHEELKNIWYSQFENNFTRVPGLFTSVKFKRIYKETAESNNCSNLVSIILKRYAVVLAIPGYDELVVGQVIKHIRETKVVISHEGIACAILNDKGIEIKNGQCVYTCNRVIRIFNINSIIYDDTENSLILQGAIPSDMIKISITNYSILAHIILEYIKNIIQPNK